MAKVAETVIRGKTSYAKILGEPMLAYDKTSREWKMDLELINQATIKELKSFGIGDRIKQKEEYLDGAPYLTLKQRELRADGSPNQPIRVVEADGKTPWDQEKLIGNGSVVDVKVAIMDFGPGKKKGVYIRGVRVLDLVSYEPVIFEALTEDDEYFAGGNEDESLDAPPAKAKPKASKANVKKVEEKPWEDELDDEIEI